MKNDNLPPKIHSKKTWKVMLWSWMTYGPWNAGGRMARILRWSVWIFRGVSIRVSQRWKLAFGVSKGLHFVVWNLVFSRRDLCIKSFQSGSRFHDLVFFFGGNRNGGIEKRTTKKKWKHVRVESFTLNQVPTVSLWTVQFQQISPPVRHDNLAPNPQVPLRYLCPTWLSGIFATNKSTSFWMARSILNETPWIEQLLRTWR